MRPRFRRHLIVSILAFFFGLGMMASALQANDMALKMAVAGDAGSSGANGCAACGGDKGDAKQANCLPACMPVVHGLLPATASVAIDTADSPSILRDVPPRGSTGVPDPSPPRLSILG